MVDLGSGGGIDVFLAAGQVGETGSVIGLDMSEVSASPSVTVIGSDDMWICK